MLSIFHALGVNSTVFVQFGIFVVFYFIAGRLFFRPYARLFEYRRKETVDDRLAAERMLARAEEKLSEYQKRLDEARQSARTHLEDVAKAAHSEEARLISEARNEGKQVLQRAGDLTERIRKDLEPQLDAESLKLAKQTTEKLLAEV